jgi:hypothetical protein
MVIEKLRLQCHGAGRIRLPPGITEFNSDLSACHADVSNSWQVKQWLKSSGHHWSNDIRDMT